MGIYVQYSNSPTLVQFNELLRLFLNSSNDIDTLAWIDAYLSIRSASTEGLDNWGRILGRDRIVPGGDVFDYVLGFANGTDPNSNILDPNNDGISYIENFNTGSFYSNTNGGDNVTLTDEPYRALLQLLYSKYASNNTLLSMNSIIKAYALQTGRTDITPTGDVVNEISGTYATETGIMSVLYYFNFQLESYEIYLFENLNILPKPTGVLISVRWLGS